jgi:drug efflux transport system permease protein
MNPRRTLAMFHKEFRHILRDPRSLLMALGLPLLLLLLFGYALDLDVDRIPTLVFDADKSAVSRELIERFEGSRFFQIRGYVDSYAAIEKGIDRNSILMGLAIPRDYSRNMQAGNQANIQILLDGSDANTASIALGYADTVVRTYSFALRAGGLNRRAGLDLGVPVDTRLRVWYNPTLESKNYIVPGLIAVILMIIAALLTSLTVAREWEMGTMEQLLSTPVRPAEIVLGKMLAFFVVGALDTTISVLVGIFIFHVPFRGNLLLLAATACIFLSGAFFWGILLSAVAKSQLLAYQLGILSTFLPSFLLSGFIYAIENMPPAIQAITHIIPARYFVNILKGIFLKGVGLNVLLGEITFLTVFSGLVFLLATRRLKQKLA